MFANFRKILPNFCEFERKKQSKTVLKVRAVNGRVENGNLSCRPYTNF